MPKIIFVSLSQIFHDSLKTSWRWKSYFTWLHNSQKDTKTEKWNLFPSLAMLIAAIIILFSASSSTNSIFLPWSNFILLFLYHNRSSRVDGKVTNIVIETTRWWYCCWMRRKLCLKWNYYLVIHKNCTMNDDVFYSFLSILFVLWSNNNSNNCVWKSRKNSSRIQ